MTNDWIANVNTGDRSSNITVRVALIDHRTIIRDGLRSQLNDQSGFEVVFDADAPSDLSRVPDCDVVLLHLRRNGGELDKSLRSLFPVANQGRPGIIIFAEDVREVTIRKAIQTGVLGVVQSNCDSSEFFRAVQRVSEGKKHLCSECIATMSNHIADEVASPIEPSSLPPRQFEILVLLAEEYEVKQIAVKLHISVKTVEVHRRKLFERLGVQGVAGLTRYAIRHGLVSLSE